MIMYPTYRLADTIWRSVGFEILFYRAVPLQRTLDYVAAARTGDVRRLCPHTPVVLCRSFSLCRRFVEIFINNCVNFS